MICTRAVRFCTVRIIHYIFVFAIMAPPWQLPPEQEDDWWVFTHWAQWYQYLQRQVGPVDHWPHAVSRLALTERHLDNQGRFTVAVFLLANGVPPDAVRNYFEFRFRFDAAAWRQLNWIIHRYPGSNWRAWNVMLGRSI